MPEPMGESSNTAKAPPAAPMQASTGIMSENLGDRTGLPRKIRPVHTAIGPRVSRRGSSWVPDYWPRGLGGSYPST